MEHYSIARAFEDSVKSGVAPEYIFEKPENTFSQQYAYWRFLNHLRVKPSITLDHGVLLRQAIRWSNNSIFIGDCDSDLLKVGKKCGVELTAGNLVTMPYKPHWLKENRWSDTDGLDRPPDPIALNEKELADSGVTQSYVRLCIGLEHIDDIIDDLDQALNKSSKGTLKAVS